MSLGPAPFVLLDDHSFGQALPVQRRAVNQWKPAPLMTSQDLLHGRGSLRKRRGSKLIFVLSFHSKRVASAAQRGQGTLIVESKDDHDNDVNDDHDDDNFLIQEEKPSATKSFVRISIRMSDRLVPNLDFFVCRNKMTWTIGMERQAIKMRMTVINMVHWWRKWSMRRKVSELEVNLRVNGLMW